MMMTSPFGAKGLEPEDTTLIFFFQRCRGGSGLVADKKKMKTFLPFSRQNVLIDINTLTIKNSGFLRKFF